MQATATGDGPTPTYGWPYPARPTVDVTPNQPNQAPGVSGPLATETACRPTWTIPRMGACARGRA
eukprot:749810-Hanusia_phi.AAC.1